MESWVCALDMASDMDVGSMEDVGGDAGGAVGSGESGVADAIAAAAFVQTIQRDLNCLSDPDRSTRRKALERLDKHLTKGDTKNRMLQIVWDETILRILVRSLHDPVEKCREVAVNLISDVVKLIPEVEQTTNLVIPVIAERIGQLPLLEKSEEIRLNLVNLLILLTSRCSVECIQDTFEAICRMICLSLMDSFHEIKKATCQLVAGIAERAPDDVSDKSEVILKALLPNASHAHSRVRLAVLSALNSVVLCGLAAGMVADCVAPGIKAVAFDHSDAVREAFFTCIARWLGYETNVACSANEIKDPKPYIPHLLPLLLLGVTDESPDISATTLALVEGVGDVYKHWTPSESALEKLDHSRCRIDMNLLPAPFKGEPGHGSRLMVQNFLRQIIGGCLKDLQDWTIITRLGAARLLQTTLAFAEGQASFYLDLLIPSFCSAVGDDEVRVAQRVVRAVHILGFYAGPELWLDLIMDPITSLRSTGAQRANGLVVLAGLLYGTPTGTIRESSVVQMSQGLSQADLFLDDNLAIRRQLFAVINNLVVKAGSLCKVSSKEIFVLLLKLQSTDDDAQLRHNARGLIETLARVTGYDSTKELYVEHMSDLINQATAGHDEWLGSSPGRLLFQTVLQSSGILAGPYLKEVLPVFANCLRPDRDPALRISLLQLLDELFEISGLESWWRSLAKEVIQGILIPCGVWQSGKVGAAVRHATMVALGTFLRRDLCSQADLLELLESEQMLPVVTSCLEEDFYVDTRRVSCHVVENIVHIAGRALKDDYRVKIGAVLQKRLDDSNDDVRLGILRAISGFFSTLPPSYSDMDVRASLSSLVVHMDDQNLQIKEAVCRAVEQCALRKPALVAEIVKEVRSKHQSTQYCDYLLTVAASVQTKDYVESAASN